VADLRGEDLEVDAGEALEVLPEEALGVVLPDLLPRHRRRPSRALWKLRGGAGACVRSCSERAAACARDSGSPCAAAARTGRTVYIARPQRKKGKAVGSRDRDAPWWLLVSIGHWLGGPLGRFGLVEADGIRLGWCGEWCDMLDC
jgi:hypothetical protein